MAEDEQDDGLTEAELDAMMPAEDEADEPANSDALADETTRELVEFVERQGQSSVDDIAFDQLAPGQLGELGERRFGDYLAWRDDGGRSSAEQQAQEVEDFEPHRQVPDWGSEALTPNDKWQEQAAKLYGVGHPDGAFYQGDES